ncbi:LysR substrate-binding domain-containing protein [uncultured Roseibium sp.]|uniref:LysR substrate-binding domain-containing protein n=1 Tax=uncultured Roseibium sp. TaxID=1936171 RepID=UPI0032175A41
MGKLRNLDLNLLVVFENIYTAGNITHAARKLGLTQPTISNALSRLRETLEDPLFTRSTVGVTPTSRAMQMIGPVREALMLINDGVLHPAAFDPATTRRHFRVAIADYLEPVLIPPIIRQIQSFRSVSLEALPLSTTHIAEGLNNGSLDIAITAHMHGISEVSCREIGAAGIVVIARKDHPRVSNPITAAQFGSLGHIALIAPLRRMTKIDEQLNRAGIERHIVYEASKMWSFPYIVSHTDLIGLLPGDFARIAEGIYPITCHPVPFDLPEQHSFITWKKGRENDPAVRWLISRLSESAPGG